MFRHFLKIHCDESLARIAFKMDSTFVKRLGKWICPREKQIKADKLVGDFRKRERQIEEEKNLLKQQMYYP